MLAVLIRLDLLRLARDRVGWLLSLALPLLLSGIMGLAFGGFGGGGAGISAIPLAIVGDLPASARRLLGDGMEGTGLFTVTWTDSATADRWVRRGKVQAAIVLPDSLLRYLFSERPLEIVLWEDVNSPVKAGIVEQMLARAVASFQTGEAVYRSVWDDDPFPDGVESLEGLLRGESVVDLYRRLRRDDPALGNLREGAVRLLDRQAAMVEAFRHPPLVLSVVDREVRPAGGTDGGPVNMYDYFLPSMAVFFLMFAVSARLGGIHREREEGTLRRLLVTPLTPARLLAGKWAGAVAVAVVQLGILLLAGRLLFRVHLGNDPFTLPVVAVTAAVLVASLFLVLALLTRDEKQMGGLGTVVILVGAMLGGTFIPTGRMPAFLQGAGRLTPTWWLNRAFQDVVLRRGDLSTVGTPLAVLLAMTAVLLAVAGLVLRVRTRRGGLL